MYSDKVNLSVLTVLLREHGVRRVVVCPGSRNAAVVNNLMKCGDFECHAATDERSAGFEALGMALGSGEVTAVCVTSGSALLNLAPAVCEAWHQHVPIVVISADRPGAWINQLDGQTIEQEGALSRWCGCSVNLPEICPSDDGVSHWHCNWLVNKALVEARRRRLPVHINIPLSEPLYQFTKTDLDEERVVRMESAEEMVQRFRERKRVMIVVGQRSERIEFAGLDDCAAVVAEPLANSDRISMAADDTIGKMEKPEMVIYLGGTVVGKCVKQFLRSASDTDQWFVTENGEYADTFMNLRHIVEANLAETVMRLAEAGRQSNYAQEWKRLCTAWRAETQMTMEEMAVVRLEQMMKGRDATFCYANSMAVRYSCRHSAHYIYCNRGVNGIEGTLSTAVGVARTNAGKPCVCVMGDLSFFYDSNAMWRNNLPKNLRIMVMNNGGGKIFGRFEALKESAAHDSVTGRHTTECRHLCESHGVEHRNVERSEEIEQGLEWLMSGEGVRLLEIKA